MPYVGFDEEFLEESCVLALGRNGVLFFGNCDGGVAARSWRGPHRIRRGPAGPLGDSWMHSAAPGGPSQGGNDNRFPPGDTRDKFPFENRLGASARLTITATPYRSTGQGAKPRRTEANALGASTIGRVYFFSISPFTMSSLVVASFCSNHVT